MTKTYDVTIRFQFPAWDEKDGITYAAVAANTKAEAIQRARQKAQRDGHLPSSGRGRASLTARAAA
jgi:hypothetical protein